MLSLDQVTRKTSRVRSIDAVHGSSYKWVSYLHIILSPTVDRSMMLGTEGALLRQGAYVRYWKHAGGHPAERRQARGYMFAGTAVEAALREMEALELAPREFLESPGTFLLTGGVTRSRQSCS